MRNELLNHLQLDDLKGETHELAETIGMDAFRRLVDVYGGTGRVYIPQADTLLIPIRDRLIREEYNGYNVYELCKKWDLGESMVRTIIRDKIRELRQAPIDGQVSLFDAPEIAFLWWMAAVKIRYDLLVATRGSCLFLFPSARRNGNDF